MAVTVSDVEHVARLARLSFTEEEKRTLVHQLNSILEYMDQLNTVNTDAVEPLSHVITYGSVLREDIVKPGVPTDKALQNAPAGTGEYFSVPKVIDDR